MSPPQQPGTKPRNAYGRMKHKQNLETFAKDLSSAVAACLPSYDKPYGQVSVLALDWANDDLGVSTLETELLNVLRNGYGFNIESFIIPTTVNAEKDLFFKISDFVRKWDAPDALTIYVYSGHAEEADPGGRHYMIGGQTDFTGQIKGPKLDWYRVSAAAEVASGDVLYILDSCFAASAAIYDGPEVLAAASWGDIAGANLQTPFTRMLIDELKALGGDPCSVANIYSSIHRNAIVNNLQRGPVHIPRRGKESIVLTRMYGPKQRKPKTYAARKHKIDALGPAEHRVIISVTLQDNISVPDINQWKLWLTTNIPSRMLSSDITIEAVFQGSSSLLLVTLPVELWTMLPADEGAYNFISFVQSNNILTQLAPAPSTSLALRPIIPGRENQPPAHKRGQSYGGPSRREE